MPNPSISQVLSALTVLDLTRINQTLSRHQLHTSRQMICQTDMHTRGRTDISRQKQIYRQKQIQESRFYRHYKQITQQASTAYVQTDGQSNRHATDRSRYKQIHIVKTVTSRQDKAQQIQQTNRQLQTD
jgi:hypothetical protein